MYFQQIAMRLSLNVQIIEFWYLFVLTVRILGISVKRKETFCILSMSLVERK
jgi:hypothetical protein